ncbi:hypothetical protein [Microcoleus sp. herbarium2]|uniref:hypothetical protein n=1 Tax=Microcoleus sp. herbarium2 TaxID=3055433 RepID=UPI002FD143D8
MPAQEQQCFAIAAVFDRRAGKSRVRSTVSLLEKVKKNESEGLWVEEMLVE